MGEKMSSSVNSIIVAGLNFCGDTAAFVVKTSGEIAAPALLGAIGGRILGLGTGTGLLQGVVSGGLYKFVIRPATNYVSKNTGKANEPNKIHPNASVFLQVLGAVSEFAVPIFVTMNYGRAILGGVSSFLPSSLQWIGDAGCGYSPGWGIALNFAPAAAQHSIAGLRESVRK